MRKAFKITLYVIGSFLALLLAAVVYLNTPWGQNFVRGRAEAFLRNKLKTEVRIGRLGYGLPKYIVLEDVLFKDQAKDTLLAVEMIRVNLSMLKLMNKKLDVQQLTLKGVHSHIYRNMPDTAYNFTYIINAFTGNKPAAETKDTSSSSFSINVDKVDLEDIHLRFDDHTGGSLLAADLGHLVLRMKKTEVEKMSFHIKELTVDGLQTSYTQDTSYLPPKPEDTTQMVLSLAADDVTVQRTTFKYNNRQNKFFFGLNLGMLQLQLNRYVLEQNIVDIKKLAINNTAAGLTFGKNSRPPAPIDTIVKIDTTEGWHVNANDIALENIDFKMDDENKLHLPAGIDYAHLDIRDLLMNMKELIYNSGSVSGNLQRFAVKESGGVDIRELRTVFRYDRHGATLNDLYLQTPNTILRDHLEVHYNSLEEIKNNMAALQLKVNVEKSIIGLHDILVFAPELEKQELFRKYRNGHINLDASLAGSVGNLNIASLSVAGMDNTNVQLNGRVSGLPETNKVKYDLRITRLESSRTDVEALVPDTLLQSVRIPDRFGITGNISGTIRDYSGDVYLVSTSGAAHVDGKLITSTGKNKEQYDLNVQTFDLNVGSIIKRDSLIGPVTMSMVAKGVSFDPATMNTTAAGSITSALIKGYRYHDVTLSGSVADKNGKVKMNIADSNLRVSLDGQADFSGTHYAVIADIDMDSIDFHALKLYKTELRTSGNIHIDFPEFDPDYPRGKLVWQQPVVTANGRRYFIDSMYIISDPKKDTGQHITVDMEVFYATIMGHTPLTKIGPIVMEHIDRHYLLPKDTTKASHEKTARTTAQKGKTDTTLPASYNLTLTAQVLDRPLLHSLFPGLTSFDPINVDGSLTQRSLMLNAAIPNVVYGPTTIENGKISVVSVDSALTYKVTADKIDQNKFALWFADIHGRVEQNTISTNISFSDAVKKERFAVIGQIERAGDTQTIRLQQGLKLNYQTWDVAQPNRIVFINDGFYVENLGISGNGQSIKAGSERPEINAPLKVDITNFRLASLTEIASPKDTMLADGILNGHIVMQQLKPFPLLTCDLQVQDLSILGDTLGNMQALVSNKDENTFDTKVTLKGRGNDILLSGNYYGEPVSGNQFNLKLDVNSLSVQSFESIAQREIRNSSGYVKGNLTIKGTPAAPDITGELRTDNLVTTVGQLNATFRLPAEKVVFSGKTIAFNNFNVLDSAGNKATFTGKIDMADMSAMQLDMDVSARNWQVVNSTSKDNKVFYGDLMVTTRVSLKGPMTSPSIDGTIRVLKGTDLTVVNQESDPQLQSTRGIVIFINMKDSARRHVLAPRKKPTKRRQSTTASAYNVNVTIDKEASFSLIIDQASGDFLTVKGNGALNAAVMPNSTVMLTGNYELTSGTYQFNYNFIKRKFSIQSGSSITFAGDPLTGTYLNVTAVYEARVPAYDLVQRQIPDPAQLNYYKQRLPFDINLYLSGPVLTPRITFDVQLPDNKVYPMAADQIELIQSKLSQVRMDTSELNKQVFAVMVLGRFVSDDPFSSGASSTVSYTAMQSVSTFLSEQLNRAAGNMVKGVDISVGIERTEDYTTGEMRQRTDLNLAASKRLLNDRLKLTIGNDFELEGGQSNRTSQSSYVPSDLAADYLLTSDGRFTLRAYRRTYDEGVLQGYVTETGLNFIVSVDYNKFKNIFQKRRPRHVAAAHNK